MVEMASFGFGSDIQGKAPNETIIKVIGVGGGGGNTINRMIESGMKNVEFIAANTDAQDLQMCRAKTRILLGEKSAKGLGAGGKPERGEAAAEEQSDAIKQVLEGANMVFITAGMGGGTGTGAAPVFARIAKELGCLTVAVVTKPFKFERPQRMIQAEEGIERLQEHVDALITIPNQQLCQITDRKLTFHEAFRLADDVLANGVRGISEIITEKGYINVDFRDVETIMANKGNALLGMVMAKSDVDPEKLAEEAITNPLVEGGSIEGATGLLVHVTCGEDIPFQVGSEIFEAISRRVASNATVITGLALNSEFNGMVRVTVIATGFEPKLPSEELLDEEVHSVPAPKIASHDMRAQKEREREFHSRENQYSNTHPANAERSKKEVPATNTFEHKMKILTDEEIEAESKEYESPIFEGTFIRGNNISNLEIPAFIRNRSDN